MEKYNFLTKSILKLIIASRKGFIEFLIGGEMSKIKNKTWLY